MVYPSYNFFFKLSWPIFCLDALDQLINVTRIFLHLNTLEASDQLPFLIMFFFSKKVTKDCKIRRKEKREGAKLDLMVQS